MITTDSQDGRGKAYGSSQRITKCLEAFSNVSELALYALALYTSVLLLADR
jgi:hypothetical protein